MLHLIKHTFVSFSRQAQTRKQQNSDTSRSVSVGVSRLENPTKSGICFGATGEEWSTRSLHID
jgi:hypothetical protein